MICSGLTLIASLLSSTLHINTTYDGTQVIHGTTGGSYGDIGYGSINITLPEELMLNSFLWNTTAVDGNETSSSIYATPEVNVTLLNNAFRLEEYFTYIACAITAIMASIALFLHLFEQWLQSLNPYFIDTPHAHKPA